MPTLSLWLLGVWSKYKQNWPFLRASDFENDSALELFTPALEFLSDLCIVDGTDTPCRVLSRATQIFGVNGDARAEMIWKTGKAADYSCSELDAKRILVLDGSHTGQL